MSGQNDDAALRGMDSGGQAPFRDPESFCVGAEQARRLPYESPGLVAYGKLQDVTLGGSPGNSDTGDPLNTKRR